MSTQQHTTSTEQSSSAPQSPVPKPVHATEEESSRLCNKWVKSGLTESKPIKFLFQTLIELGCSPPEQFIRCMNCKNPAAGGFGMVVEESIIDPIESSINVDKVANITKQENSHQQIYKEQCHRTMKDLQEQINRENEGSARLTLNPEIYICQQYMESEIMTHKTLHHELVHAIDMCRTNMDPLRNCIHMACTEIRAENLSGECAVMKELRRMKHYTGHGKECVRRRAVLSVRANPNCTSRAETYVDAAMNRCYMDFYPYKKHPNLE
jgi:Peptidase M76 family